ncbi:hypothetical protein CBR64_11955 [Cellulosimicrobium cellulans]|uniref:HTH marR-type domain-containing protein n=1 Tax=Cellulosimicrobium cellulans TaxID=1710 RepID=A0A1Y0I312_CELCE|nr:hypothetical protein CBR64_11955 [Cellulosimicrobium cellulans]
MTLGAEPGAWLGILSEFPGRARWRDNDREFFWVRIVCALRNVLDGALSSCFVSAETKDPLELEAQLCFVLSVAARGLVALYRPHLEPLGMTHPQYLVMLALWQGARVSERATVTSLADRLRLDPATLSPLLKRLEGAGYLRRVRSTDDARVVEVLLTARGNEPRGAVEDLPSAIAAATGLGGDELDGALELASRMVAAVEEAGSA